ARPAASPWNDLAQASASQGTRRREVLAVSIVSLLAHTGFAGYLATLEQAPVAAYRPPERVEVQFTRPPPPPPPPPPTPAQEPPPPPKVTAPPKPKPVAAPPKPAAAPPPIIEQETRDDIGIDAPE